MRHICRKFRPQPASLAEIRAGAIERDAAYGREMVSGRKGLLIKGCLHDLISEVCSYIHR